MDNKEIHPMVPVPEAIRMVLKETARILIEDKISNNPITISANAPWSELLHQVLDEDVVMAEPGYPPYNASVMDGYALRTSEAKTSDNDFEWTHHVIDKVHAGDDAPPTTTTTSGSSASNSSTSSTNGSLLPPAYYITTGAVVPTTCNCVVPIEECQVSDDKQHVRIHPSAVLKDQKWIRPMGCDIPAGSVVLPKGHVMDPIALGLLKQSKATHIKVRRPIVVGVLSTGNELLLGDVDEDNPKNNSTGKIPDVNRPILLNLVKESSSSSFCVETVDLGNERDDDVEAMAKTIDKALDLCDVIITTGGISMGETDIVEQVLVDHCGGKLHLGRMHMKPGKPTTFITIPKDGKTTMVFAMPGNPVSAAVCTQLLVKPCLDLLFHGIENNNNNNDNDNDKMIENNNENNNQENVLNHIVNHAFVHPEMTVTLGQDYVLDKQRPEYLRVMLQRQQPNGSYVALPTGNQQSSRLMSCRDAQGLLLLPVGTTQKPKASKGEEYTVLLFGNLRGMDGIQVKESAHLRKKGREMKVAVVEVLPGDKLHLSKLEKTCQQVVDGLSGSSSGNACIVSKKVFGGPLEELYDSIIDCQKADIIVVSCVSYDGSFPFHLDVSSRIKSQLQKPADTLALQARQGSASQDATAALFETVVGFAPEAAGQGAIVICLPDQGIKGGLENVRGLLKHALNLARGNPHNHHHSHQFHNHAK